MSLCPCHSGQQYDLCCGPYHQSNKTAPSPEALMRSRYCAYVTKNIDYIYQTYAPSVRNKQSKADLQLWADSVSFIHLEIISAPPTTQEDENSKFGYVEFIASYLQKNQLHKLQERSRFIHTTDHWFYLDGQLTPHNPLNIGRNENCPCGSGKKFKRCHG